MPVDILTDSPILTNMKPVVEAKMTLVDKKEVSSGCGRSKYLGIDMAFMYVRGKRMLTMSEISRKLYPHWPRTTLYDRVRQMRLRKHTCTPREIEKVLSVNGVVKQGIHCTLISKEDLDIFRSVYKINPSATGIKEKGLASKELSGNDATQSRLAGKRRQSPSQVGSKQNNHKIDNRKASFAVQTKTRRNVLNLNKQTQIDKRGTRVVRGGQDEKKHVSLGINTVNSINKTARSNSVFNSPLKQLNAIRKRKHFASKEIEKVTPKRRCGGTKIQRKETDTSYPPSDCTSLDSGISSLTLDVAENAGSKKISRVGKSDPKSTKLKNKSGSKFKDSKRDGLAKLKDGKLKNHKSGLKRKGGKMKGSQKNEKGTGFKKSKKTKINKGGSDTITKEYIIKMDLKNMNDNDLINSLSSSPFSSHHSTSPHTEDLSGYCVKLMPVKPVWRVNSSFKFISNFLLTPSLVVRDGELKPACSMVCRPGQRPPSAHPIWKWKIGEPVIGNKTEISYRLKKVKCVDSQTK